MKVTTPPARSGDYRRREIAMPTSSCNATGGGARGIEQQINRDGKIGDFEAFSDAQTRDVVEETVGSEQQQPWRGARPEEGNGGGASASDERLALLFRREVEDILCADEPGVRVTNTRSSASTLGVDRADDGGGLAALRIAKKLGVALFEDGEPTDRVDGFGHQSGMSFNSSNQRLRGVLATDDPAGPIGDDKNECVPAHESGRTILAYWRGPNCTTRKLRVRHCN